MKRLLSWFAMAALAVSGLVVATGSPSLAAFPAAGRYKIINARSGHCLEQSWAGGTQRAQILAVPCTGGSNQIWQIWDNNLGGNVHEIVNWRSDKCLNQSYSTGSETKNIIAFPCQRGTNGLNEKWGTYTTTNWGDSIANHESGKCLDQDYSNNTPHATVIAFRCKSIAEMTSRVTNQTWYFARA